MPKAPVALALCAVSVLANAGIVGVTIHPAAGVASAVCQIVVLAMWSRAVEDATLDHERARVEELIRVRRGDA